MLLPRRRRSCSWKEKETEKKSTRLQEPRDRPNKSTVGTVEVSSISGGRGSAASRVLENTCHGLLEEQAATLPGQAKVVEEDLAEPAEETGQVFQAKQTEMEPEQLHQEDVEVSPGEAASEAGGHRGGHNSSQ